MMCCSQHVEGSIPHMNLQSVIISPPDEQVPRMVRMTIFF
jgi:hypothetical protein